MSTKETKDDKEKDLEIDLEDFERQIDDEIDRLFVPLGSAADALPDAQAAVEKPRPKGERPVAASPVGDDLSAQLRAPTQERPIAKEPPVSRDMQVPKVPPKVEKPPVFELPPERKEAPVLEVPSQEQERMGSEETLILEGPEAFEKPPVPEEPPVLELPPEPEEPAVLEAPPEPIEPPVPEMPMQPEEPPVLELPPEPEEPLVLEVPPPPKEPPRVEEPVLVKEPAWPVEEEEVRPVRKRREDVTISLDDVMPVSEEPEPDVLAAPAPDATELEELLELFNVAFLSLDWEFSPENVSRLDTSLVKLAPYCREVHEAHTLYKVMKVVFQQWTSEPGSASPQVIELVRDSEGLLKDLLLSESGLDSPKRGRFKALINRARDLRNEGLLGTKPPRPPATQARPVVEVERVEVSPVVVPQEPEKIAAVDWKPLEELRKWIEASRGQSGSAAQRLQDESKRLRQLEQVLGKTPVLAPAVARMSSVRSGMEGCVTFLNEYGREWEKRLDWIADFEKKIEETLARLPEQAASDEEALEEIALEQITPEELAQEELAPEELAQELEASEQTALEQETSEEQAAHLAEPVEAESPGVEVCSYRLSGKRFAVPASVVVRIEPLSSRKANKIRERGYATLADFKPIFRSIKTGVIGRWSDLPASLLKTFMFVPLPYRALRAPGVPSIAGTAILLSSGDKHGIIFAEPDGVRMSSEIITPALGEEGVLGVIQSEEGPPIEVLNIEEILKEHREPEAEESLPSSAE